jgi:hypothetical protein
MNCRLMYSHHNIVAKQERNEREIEEQQQYQESRRHDEARQHPPSTSSSPYPPCPLSPSTSSPSSMKRSISMAPTLVVRQCKEVGARAGKGQRVYAPSGDGKVATRVKMGAWIETRSGEDTVILFSFSLFLPYHRRLKSNSSLLLV